MTPPTTNQTAYQIITENNKPKKYIFDACDYEPADDEVEYTLIVNNIFIINFGANEGGANELYSQLASLNLDLELLEIQYRGGDFFNEQTLLTNF